MKRDALEELTAPRPPRNPANAAALERAVALHRPEDPDAPALAALATAAALVRGTVHEVVSLRAGPRGGVAVVTAVREYAIDRMGNFH